MMRWRLKAWTLQLGTEWQHFSSDFYKLTVQHQQTWRDNLSTFIRFITTKWHINLPSYIIFMTLSFPFKRAFMLISSSQLSDKIIIRLDDTFWKTAIIMCLCAHNTKILYTEVSDICLQGKILTQICGGGMWNCFLSSKKVFMLI